MFPIWAQATTVAFSSMEEYVMLFAALFDSEPAEIDVEGDFLVEFENMVLIIRPELVEVSLAKLAPRNLVGITRYFLGVRGYALTHRSQNGKSNEQQGYNFLH
eukprot:TRINITY_DN2206_c0_g2_i1.p3 TRINITY_DN2206_c0_g2~~TRINITY_DN2206_c0_g2_i1.p3  ORF type:complete len:103 (+),score=4.14 TRINITY_DN2206_c0_g2_i1:462-770(+)